jgi:hypothetical protein
LGRREVVTELRHARDIALPGDRDRDVLQRACPATLPCPVREHEATIRIEDGVVEGDLPKRAHAHVIEWYALHREELQDNWEQARKRKPLRKIEPLE